MPQFAAAAFAGYFINENSQEVFFVEGLIRPHGGSLVNRLLEGKERDEAAKRAEGLKKIHLTDREISDIEMMSIGALSPLEGFMGRDDYHSVMDTMHMKNGLPWTIPITLSVTSEEAKALKPGMEVSLTDDAGTVLAVMSITLHHNLQRHARQLHFETLVDVQSSPVSLPIADQGGWQLTRRWRGSAATVMRRMAAVWSAISGAVGGYGSGAVIRAGLNAAAA